MFNLYYFDGYWDNNKMFPRVSSILSTNYKDLICDKTNRNIKFSSIAVIYSYFQSV